MYRAMLLCKYIREFVKEIGMKSYKTVGILLGLLMVIGLISGCAIPSHKHSVNQTESARVEDDSNISVESIASRIKIVVEDRTDVEAVFKGTLYTTSSREPELVVTENGSDLRIYIDYSKKNMNVGDDSTTLTVYIPESFNGDFSVDSISGDVTVPDMVLSDVELETISGEIICDTIEAMYTKFETVSGDIEVRACISEEIIAESVSGEIEVYIPEFARADIDTSSVSGSVRTEDGSSGETTMNIDMELSTVSGDITVRRY